jgi:hypothetical protein
VLSDHSSVEVVHHAVDVFGQKSGQNIGRTFNLDVELDPIGLPRAPQYKIGHGLTTRRAANPDAQAEKVLCVKVLLHRLETIVTSQAPANLQLRGADLKIELIVDDEQVLYIGDAIPLHKIANAPSGIVHEGLREGSDNQLRFDSKFGHTSRLLRRFQGCAMASRKELNNAGADIMASAVVLIARVPETNDEKVGGSSRAIRRLTAKHCEIFASTGDAKS